MKSKELFDCPFEEKRAYPRDMTTDEFYQIGYCGIGEENLDPDQPGDLKEYRFLLYKALITYRCIDTGDFNGKSYLRYLHPTVQRNWDRVLHFQSYCKALRDRLLTHFALAMNVDTLLPDWLLIYSFPTTTFYLYIKEKMMSCASCCILRPRRMRDRNNHQSEQARIVITAL